MKQGGLVLLLLLSLCRPGNAVEAIRFEDYFTSQTLRVDYFHTGEAKAESITLDRVYEQGEWAGSRKNLLDPFGVGRYSVQVTDAASGVPIFSRGYDSCFGEYRTTAEAAQGIARTYHETVLLPCPKKPVVFSVFSRDPQNQVHRIFSCPIDPAGPYVVHEPPARGVTVIPAHVRGTPSTKVDLTIVAEGYTRDEEVKFRQDLKRFTGILLGFEPYHSLRDRFNVRGAFKPSTQSGADEPSHGSFRNTTLSARFDSFGSERYLLTEDNKALQDIIACVPTDAIVILVNHKRYGGGGIYNCYCTLTSDNQWHPYLLLHEFGHSFTGLADEYYTSQVAYNEFYPPGVEPVEANITALLDPARLKWQDLVTPGTAIPTPWEKAGFDEQDLAYQKVRQEVNGRIAHLKRKKAPAAEIAELEAESERLSLAAAKKSDDYLRAGKYWGQVGAFEGAGYASTGLYRPMADCLMFTKGTKPFCRVCEAAVRRMIQFYTE